MNWVPKCAPPLFSFLFFVYIALFFFFTKSGVFFVFFFVLPLLRQGQPQKAQPPVILMTQLAREKKGESALPLLTFCSFYTIVLFKLIDSFFFVFLLSLLLDALQLPWCAFINSLFFFLHVLRLPYCFLFFFCVIPVAVFRCCSFFFFLLDSLFPCALTLLFLSAVFAFVYCLCFAYMRVLFKRSVWHVSVLLSHVFMLVSRRSIKKKKGWYLSFFFSSLFLSFYSCYSF